MAQSVGEIGLDLVVNQKQFDKQMGGIQNLAKKTGKILASAFAIKELVKFSAECLELGSDLQEVQNVVDVTFPSMNKQVNEFAKNAASSFGLSETMAKKFTGTFGSMAKAFGFAEEDAYGMAKALTGLAGDVASFYNLSQEEAYTKLKSVFTGETESLKDLGVVMTQTALDSFALAKGFGKTTSAMSESEKVALRYAFVQEQLSAASGDFISTSGSWANQVKVLTLQFDSFKASIGQGLINILTPAIQTINLLMAKLVQLGETFKNFTERFFGDAGTSDGLENAADSASDMSSGINAAEKSAKKLKNALYGFDSLNVMPSEKDEGVSTSVSAPAIDFDFSGAEKSTEDATKQMGGLFDTLMQQFDFNPLITSFNDLKTAMEPIIGPISDSLKWFFDNVIVPLSAWTIEDALPAFFDLLSGALEVLDPLLVGIQTPLQWLWDNFLQPIAEWTGGVIVTVLGDIGDALSTIGTWMSDNQDLVNTITTAVAGFFAAWKVTELLGFIQMSGGVVAALKNIWTWLVANTVAKLKDKIETMAIIALYAKDFVVSLAKGTAALVKQAAQWVAMTAVKIADKIATIASTVATGAMTAATWALNAATAVLTSPIFLIIAAIAALIAVIVLVVKNFDVVKEVATNVFNAIWDVIKKVINAILGGIESLVNGVVNGVNFMIRALNKLKFDVPEWVPVIGGGTFGFNLKELSPVELPRLAQGGYVKANTPRLAMIGDNKRYGEIVAPEDKMYDISYKAMADVMKMFMSQLASAKGNGQEVIKLVVSGELAPLIRLLKVELDKESERTGRKFEVVLE